MPEYTVESKLVAIEDLRPHPDNYRHHPDEQLAHIEQSIKDHGFYRNVVIANDGTILAGHGVVQAAKRLGMESVTVVQLEVGPHDPKALKVLTGDNEISNLCAVDDRVLTEVLKQIKEGDTDSGLLGTGFNDRVLANLLFVTRPSTEINNEQAASEWVGMPEHAQVAVADKLIVSFENDEDKAEFARRLGLTLTDKTRGVWFPHKETLDLASIQLED